MMLWHYYYMFAFVLSTVVSLVAHVFPAFIAVFPTLVLCLAADAAIFVTTIVYGLDSAIGSYIQSRGGLPTCRLLRV